MLFRKIATFALFTPLIAALQLDQPKGTWYSQQPVTISWNSQPTDQIFSIYLVNEAFHDTFGIANNVQPGQGSVTLTLPAVPDRAGYRVIAVNVGNINDVYSSTSEFSIAANPSTTSSASSTSGTSTGTGTSTGVSITTRPTAGTTTSGFGTTLTNPATTATGTGLTTKPATNAPSTSPSSTPFNGAASFKVNTFAAAVFSIAAGAAVLIL